VPFRHAIFALTQVFDHGQVVDRKLCHAIRRIFDAQTTDSFAAAFKEGIGEVKACLAGRHFVEFPQGKQSVAVEAHAGIQLSGLSAASFLGDQSAATTPTQFGIRQYASKDAVRIDPTLRALVSAKRGFGN
jgi:hypothetical protein